MLVKSIIPMPQLDPAEYVALYLTNPLLLAEHPVKMQATAEKWAAGQYDRADTVRLAAKLHELRKYVVNQRPVEEDDQEAQRELLELADHPLIERRERANLRAKIFGSRPSEYTWLRGPIEAAITARAMGREMAQLVAA